MKVHVLIYAIAVMAVCTAALSPCDAGNRHYRKEKQTGIVAHRGYWNCEEAGYAKNSVAALREAQERHFWGSEFDVNMTADSVLIVYHDSYIDGKRIEDFPWSEFKDIRLANGEPIPTIDMYLVQGRKHPGTMLVYEMKPHSSPEVEDIFIDLTIRKLKEYRLLKPGRVMFISFSFHICQRLAELLPGFTVQYLEGDKTPDEVLEHGINGIDYRHTVFSSNPQWAETARELGMTTNTWTVNRPDDIRNMLGQKIMYITTDEPLTVRKLIKETGRRECR